VLSAAFSRPFRVLSPVLEVRALPRPSFAASRNAPFAVAPGVALRVWVREPELSVAVTGEAPGGSLLGEVPVRLPTGDCVNDIRIIWADGRPEERRQVDTCRVTNLVFQ
jgi:hypothetical protein